MATTTFNRLIAVALCTSLALAPMHVVVAHAEPTAADLETARDLYKQAKKLRAEGDLKGALEKLKAAHALAGTPITGLELGRTLAQVGSLVAAREVLLSIARIPPAAQETARSATARKDAADLAESLRARIPTLVVKIAGAPAEGLTVTIDGEQVPAASVGEPRPVDPGKHAIVATAAGGGRAEGSATLAEGEARTVELTIAPGAATSGAAASASSATTAASPSASPSNGAASSAPSSSAPAATASRPLGPLVYAGFGAGAVGVIVGTVTGIVAFSKASTVKNECPGNVCLRSADSDIQSGRTFGNVSTAGFLVGAAGVAVGALGLVLRGSAEAPPASSGAVVWHPWIGAGAAGVRGSF